MIDKDLAASVLRVALARGGDLAELYVEDVVATNLQLDDGKIEQALRGADRGAGVRVFYGNTAAYAYTDDLGEEHLLEAARAAAAAGQGSNQNRVLDLTQTHSQLEFPVKAPFDVMPLADKADLLHRCDETARGYHPHIRQVAAGYNELRRRVWLYNSEGRWVEDDRNYVELRFQVTAQSNGVTQQVTTGIGAQSGLELLQDKDPIAEIADVSESAIKMLEARPAPAGEMMVVMCNGWGGVLFHEACGHALEADFYTKGTSAYTRLLGERVANDLITLIDDGTIPGRRGSLRFDDDGTASQRNVLIENGILNGFMWDLAEARRAGRRSTGNGRRQSYRHMPMPRMTNTFINAGPHAPEEIIRSVQKGLYVKRMGGGQADIAKGDFAFNVTEGYLIEDGKLTAPVRGATLVGNGPEVMRSIDMLGHDQALDKGMGMCGKMQTARVSVGQPTLRIPRIIVGGAEAGPAQTTMG